MRISVLAGTLLIGVAAASSLAAMAPSRKALALNFRRPTIVVSTLIQGQVVFEHDDARMARGEPCTTIYKYDDKLKARGATIVEFMCTPRERALAKQFEATCSRGEGAGPDRLVEYQFPGDTEGHGVPSF